MKNDILRIKQVKNMSKCLKFCKMQIGTQTKALDERNWFASRVFLANEKWHFDNQISQKHVKMPQILQNTNRYSNESSRRKELFASRVFLANEKWDFDNQISQKLVKLPQILQNTNRYSNESSWRKELICLKGFTGKWKMRFWQPNKSKTCQNASNFAKYK